MVQTHFEEALRALFRLCGLKPEAGNTILLTISVLNRRLSQNIQEVNGFKPSGISLNQLESDFTKGGWMQ
jgi:hypothetical protein